MYNMYMSKICPNCDYRMIQGIHNRIQRRGPNLWSRQHPLTVACQAAAASLTHCTEKSEVWASKQPVDPVDPVESMDPVAWKVLPLWLGLALGKLGVQSSRSDVPEVPGVAKQTHPRQIAVLTLRVTRPQKFALAVSIHW